MTRAEIEDWDEDVLIAIYADDRMTRAQLDAGLAALTRLRDAAFEVERLRATVERVREAVGFIDGLVREAREVIKAVEDAGRSPTVHEICVLAMADTCERLAGLLRQALEAP